MVGEVQLEDREALCYYTVLRVYLDNAASIDEVLDEGADDMAVPKQRKGRMSTRIRRSTHDRIDAPARSVCPQCGEAKLPHRVCPNCGYYKNREVIETE